MLKIIIAAIALIIILVMIWHEEKIIAFEERLSDKIADRIGYYIAQVILWYRRTKRNLTKGR